MFLGYNTNGMANHDLFDAVRLLAEIGYRGVAITIDHGVLSPGDKGSRRQIIQLKELLRDLGLRSVIETGARFLLDPRLKHEPTLVSADSRRRIEFYKYAVDCAAELGGDCVSLWSGAVRDEKGTGSERSEVSVPFSEKKATGSERSEVPVPFSEKKATGSERSEVPVPFSVAMDRLVQGLHEVLDYATRQGVVIALEPEPGMLIDSTRGFEDLLKQIDAPHLALTLDIGHLQCQGETPIAEIIRRWSARLMNVHIEDMKTGVHEHLMFGEGEIIFPPVICALAESDYAGGLYVELSRHSHDAPRAAKKAFDFFKGSGFGVQGSGFFI